MKTLLFIAHSPDFYGADRVLHQVVDELRRDHRVHVVLPGPGEMMRRLQDLDRVEISVLPLPRFSLAAGDMIATAVGFVPFLAAFRRLLLRLRPAAVYGNTIRSLLPVAAARALGFPTLVHFHERNLPGAAGRAVARLAGCAGLRNIFVCRSALESYAVHCPGLEGKSTVIYNGIDPSPLPEAPEPELFRGGSPRLLSIAQLAPHKRIGDLVEALPALLAEHPRAVLAVLGEGELRGELERRAGELGLGNRLHLPGYVADPSPYLRAADVFLAPFENEACNMSVIEAMAAGKPVVAAAGGGMPELVAEGVTGFLHPPGDLRQLTAGVLRLAGSAGLRRRLGEAGARRAAERFSLPIQMERIRREVATVAQGGGG